MGNSLASQFSRSNQQQGTHPTANMSLNHQALNETFDVESYPIWMVDDDDLDFERVQFKLCPWRERIRDDAQCLYSNANSQALWSYFGHQASDVEKHWRTHTTAWIKQQLQSQKADQQVEAQYKKYCARFKGLTKAMTAKMRKEQMAATVDKYAGLMSPQASMSALATIEREPEGLSALYFLLQQRPDMVQR